ncbi:MAG TPA: hypothetical protein VJ654_03330 [Noviherbaspirillum sp.]|nr:hypothetical protein [Noviherbaspirillum sp.]
MMDELDILANLSSIARAERAVAHQPLDDGMQMLVYPMETALLVGLGYDGNESHRVIPEEVLRKRSGNMERFGAWLPSMFSDGGVYIVKRVAHPAENGDAPLSQDDLSTARELLS